MNSSDIIAIVAIITSLIISVTSTGVSYFINRNNIQAKRSEIAFERRLDGFREIIEKIGNIRTLLVESSVANINDSQDDFKKALSDFYFAYRKNLVFLPPHIADKETEYGKAIDEIIRYEYSYENIDNFYVEHKKYENQIIDEMQKFIGYV